MYDTDQAGLMPFPEFIEWSLYICILLLHINLFM